MSQYNPENYPPVEDEPTRENPRLVEELKEMLRGDKAWEDYKGYGEEYERENAERVRDGKIKAYRWEDKLTMVAQIKLDSQGRVVDGHDRNPEAQSHRDTEAEWQRYLQETADDPASRIVLVEGDPVRYPHPKTDPESEARSRATAITERADGGLAMWLATGEGVEVARSEPDRAELITHMREAGRSTEEIATYNFLTNITEKLDRLDDQDLAMYVYGSLALDGAEGFNQLSGEEKKILIAEGRVPQLEAHAREYALAKLNPILKAWGITEFSLDEQGRLRLPGQTTQRIWADLQTGEPGKISQDNITYRDKRIFTSVTQAIKDGKKPFMVYGGSHVVALRPALDAYFGEAAVIQDPENGSTEAQVDNIEMTRLLDEVSHWADAADTLSQSRVMRNFLGMLMNSSNAPAEAQTLNEALARLHQGVVDKKALEAHVQAGTLPEGNSESHNQMVSRINESIQVALTALQASLDALKRSPQYSRTASELEGLVVSQIIQAKGR